jgi:hypothetical protein
MANFPAINTPKTFFLIDPYRKRAGRKTCWASLTAVCSAGGPAIKGFDGSPTAAGPVKAPAEAAPSWAASGPAV